MLTKVVCYVEDLTLVLIPYFFMKQVYYNNMTRALASQECHIHYSNEQKCTIIFSHISFKSLYNLFLYCLRSIYFRENVTFTVTSSKMTSFVPRL